MTRKPSSIKKISRFISTYILDPLHVFFIITQYPLWENIQLISMSCMNVIYFKSLQLGRAPTSSIQLYNAMVFIL